MINVFLFIVHDLNVKLLGVVMSKSDSVPDKKAFKKDETAKL